ncbi:MAG TPA: response regulator transcription factor [Bacilli bacterium]|nr:response regulator transcription factor [Bacilli bacterium]
MVTILIVDDDAHIRELIDHNLKREGMHTLTAANGEEALALMDKTAVDLVILDVMMPHKNGWELTEDIRHAWDMPLLMLTALGESGDKIKGFELGVDDYLVKPFDPQELVMRVKALLRRAKISVSQVLTFHDLHIDAKNYLLQKGSLAISLPPKEFDLLFKLASYPGQIFTRSQLIEQIWGLDYQGDERTVDVHIKRLRERLAEIGTDTVRLATVRGLGYRLEVRP